MENNASTVVSSTAASPGASSTDGMKTAFSTVLIVLRETPIRIASSAYVRS